MALVGIPWMEWVLTISLGAAILWVVVSKVRDSKLKLPPGPGAYPIVGSFPLLGGVPREPSHRMFRRLAEKFGPIMFLKMGSNPTVVVTDSNMAKLVLKDQDHIFASRPYLSMGKYLGMNFNSLVFSQMGDHYKQLRKIYTSELLSPKRVQESHKVREDAMFVMLSTVFEQAKQGQAIDLTEQLNDLALYNLMNMIFGRREGQTLVRQSRVSMEELKEVVRACMDVGGEFNAGDFIPIARVLDLTGVIRRMKKLQKRMRFIAKEFIEENRGESEGKGSKHLTLLNVLLSLKGQDALSDDAITGVIFDMIIAGSDTTSITADWAIAELMKKPDKLRRLQREIESVVGMDRHVTEADLPNMPYLHCVVKEALRMHSPAPLGIPHYTHQATTLAGYDIPAGTTMLVNLWALNRDPKNWPNADDFTPERFEEHDVQIFGQDFTLLPFSAGRRGCSGMVLGFTMSQFLVASVLHSFDLEPHGMGLADMDVEHEKPGLTMQRAQELTVRVSPRLPSHLYTFK